MEIPPQLLELRDWAFDLSQWPQKFMWAGLALLFGYLIGHIVAITLKFIWRRLTGLARSRARMRKGAAAQAPADAPEETATDSMLLDILGSVIRAMGLLAGAAIAAWVFGFPIQTLESWASKALLAIVILVAVWFIGAWLGSHVRRFGDRVGSHKGGAAGRTLFAFLSSLVRFGALAIGLIAALQQFGFPIASLVAVVGAAGLAIALALQDTLKAVAAGVVIAIFRPYRLGDNVRIAGQDGTVADITPFTTVLNTIDNREVVVTNDKAWGDVIVNSSARRLRRIDLLFSISYDDDIDHALSVLRRTFESDRRVRRDPAVWCKVVELAQSSIDLRVRCWCAAEDWWDLRCDMLRAVKLAFDAEGISIPYPHQVQINREEAPREPRPERTPSRPDIRSDVIDRKGGGAGGD